MAKITIPSDIDELQAVAEVSDAEGALTEILAIHRPVDYSDEYSDESYLLCGGCASAHPEPDDFPYPCKTARPILDRVSDEALSRLTWLADLAEDEDTGGDADEPEDEAEDEDEEVTPRKAGRRRRARQVEDDEDDF